MTVPKAGVRVRAALPLLFSLLGWGPLCAQGQGPPAKGWAEPAAKSPLRIAVIGDSGTGKEPQYRVAGQMARQQASRSLDLVLMLGDNIYEDGSRSGYVDRFVKPYQSLLSQGIPFFATRGNHPGRWGNWRHAHEYPLFNMGGRRYYTFECGEGLVQFFALDTTTLTGRHGDPQQLAWLQDELEASRAPWRIAFFHHPVYSSGRRHGGDRQLRESLEPILVAGRVQLVLTGHDHLYERVRVQQGILHFVNGAAAKLRKHNLSDRSPLTDCGNDQERSFLYLEVHPGELRFEAISETGRVFDRGTVFSDSGSGLRVQAHCQVE